MNKLTKYKLIKMSKEISKYGVIYYLQKIDKNVSEQRYEPVSYEYWKMLRDLEPTKFGGDYDFYIRLKKEQYESEVERRKNCESELVSKHYSFFHPDDIDKTKQTIKEIRSNERFVKWADDELVESILNYVVIPTVPPGDREKTQ